MSKRKTVRPGVREISPVSIYSKVYSGRDLRKRCVLSLEWKREGVIDGDRGGDDSVDPTCVYIQWEGERPGCGWDSQIEWGSLFQRRGAACWKERFIILSDEEVCIVYNNTVYLQWAACLWVQCIYRIYILSSVVMNEITGKSAIFDPICKYYVFLYTWKRSVTIADNVNMFRDMNMPGWSYSMHMHGAGKGDERHLLSAEAAG